MQKFFPTADLPELAVYDATQNDKQVLPDRSGTLTISSAIDAYMAAYTGRDQTRAQRMLWWQHKIGHIRLNEVDEDHIFFALDELSKKSARYWAGKNADGEPIYKSKGKPLAPATLNRYAATMGALFSWCIQLRLTPKGWNHPCRGIGRKPENNEITRFLSDPERERLLIECKNSKWPKLYLLVLMAITTGARRGELCKLKWSDIDLQRCEAFVGKTKNGDKKILPLIPAVVNELLKFQGTAAALIFASSRCPGQPYNFTPVWSEALKYAKVRSFRFHDLRHSCASYLAQNGATLLEIGDVLGHRQLSVTKRYSHLTTGHKTALINRVLGGLQ
jgi:integrase